MKSDTGLDAQSSEMSDPSTPAWLMTLDAGLYAQSSERSDRSTPRPLTKSDAGLEAQSSGSSDPSTPEPSMKSQARLEAGQPSQGISNSSLTPEPLTKSEASEQLEVAKPHVKRARKNRHCWICQGDSREDQFRQHLLDCVVSHYITTAIPVQAALMHGSNDPETNDPTKDIVLFVSSMPDGFAVALRKAVEAAMQSDFDSAALGPKGWVQPFGADVPNKMLLRGTASNLLAIKTMLEWLRKTSAVKFFLETRPQYRYAWPLPSLDLCCFPDQKSSEQQLYEYFAISPFMYFFKNFRQVELQHPQHAPPPALASLIGSPSCKETCSVCRNQSCLQCKGCILQVASDDDLFLDLGISVIALYQSPKVKCKHRAFAVLDDHAWPLNQGGLVLVMNCKHMPFGVWCPQESSYWGIRSVRAAVHP